MISPLRFGVARLALAVLSLSILSAAVVTLTLGAGRPGYDAVHSSMSRLGEPGAPGAWLFNLILSVTGLALLLAGAVMATDTRGPRSAGLAVAGAGLLLALAALVPIDAGSRWHTVVHRSVTAGALSALVVSGLAAPTPRAVGWLGVAGLALGAGLLFRGFPGGLWERCLFGGVLAEVEMVLLLLAQRRTGISAPVTEG